MSQSSVPIVTIDGPSGSGKNSGECSGNVLGWTVLDSGSLYRAIALETWRKKIDFRGGRT